MRLQKGGQGFFVLSYQKIRGIALTSPSQPFPQLHFR
jgi:hypothetical protein